MPSDVLQPIAFEGLGQRGHISRQEGSHIATKCLGYKTYKTYHTFSSSANNLIKWVGDCQNKVCGQNKHERSLTTSHLVGAFKPKQLASRNSL